MRRLILCLLFAVLLVFSLGKPAEKKKDAKGRTWYHRPTNPNGNGNGNGTVSPNGRWGGGYFYARPHPAGGWWVTPARPRPNGAG